MNFNSKLFKTAGYLCCAFTLAVLFTGCLKSENETIVPNYISEGVFIVNEGSFNAGNSSISYLNLNNQTMSNNVFESTNGFPLGDVAQSMTISDGKGYIVVNNSQKVEVVDISNMNNIATISGFQSPRYMITRGTKGYVSDWFDNNIKVIDLSTNTIINTIPTGNGPEQMLIFNQKLFVANVGGFGNETTVTVINLNTETVLATIQIGTNPNSLKLDNNNKLWVLCGGSLGPDFTGGTADDIGGSLWKIDPVSLVVEQSYPMQQGDHPSRLAINGAANYLYYLKGSDGYTGSVYTASVVNPNLNSAPFISKSFYGFNVDIASGIIYGGYVPGFTQNGMIFRYQPNGVLIDSMEVGIAPNYFIFKQL